MTRFAFSAWLWIVLATLSGGCSDGSDGPRAVDAPIDTVETPADVEPLDPRDLPEEDIPISSTESGIEYVRTPDACFDNLDGYLFQANYVEVEGLRYHYVDEGPADGEVVLMLHGQPSWSYLYRKMIPVLVDAGYRVIAPDHIGMGRSDKPVDPRVHQFEQQVAWLKSFVSKLELTDITLFVQDWGSHFGLRMAGDNPDNFARIVLANGDLVQIPAGMNPFTAPVFEYDETIEGTIEYMSQRPPGRVESFQHWMIFAATAPHLFVADIIDLATVNSLTEAQSAAYNAPFPAPIYRAGPRAFPSMVAGIESQNVPAYEELGRFDRPFMFLGGDSDPNQGSVENQNKWITHVPGAVDQPHQRYDAGHFIQEDVGEEMAAHVVEFMQRNPIPQPGPYFNVRYCEIVMPFLEADGIRARVYGTQQLNDCPQEAWDAIDTAAVATEFGAISAVKNGPRHWVIDALEVGEGGFTNEPVPGRGEITTFGDLEMRLLTTVVAPDGGGSVERYSIARVDRNTIFHFAAGRRVFELQDPQGNRYMMQSFSQIVDPDLQLHDLVRLEERLQLPGGWQFSTRILQEPFELLTVDGIAEVLQDDLSNTYQKVP
jgi:pimeloyl-ACP methyl ester carboxylesterase